MQTFLHHDQALNVPADTYSSRFATILDTFIFLLNSLVELVVAQDSRETFGKLTAHLLSSELPAKRFAAPRSAAHRVNTESN